MRRVGLGGFALTLAIGLVCFVVQPAAADTLKVEGDTLRGQIVSLGTGGVEFSPIHGKGTLKIDWSKIEAIESEGPFSVMHGDSGEATGRVLGYDEGRLLLGSDRASASRIDVARIHSSFGGSFGDDWLERMRSRLRFWQARLDAGAAYTDSTTDKAFLFSGLRIDFEKARTRAFLEGAARYATEKQQGEERNVTENILWSLLRGEIDLTQRIYSYASTRATHDTEQHLALRLEPRAGTGAHLIQREKFALSTDVGVAWIYEDFFGSEAVNGSRVSRGNSNYWSVAFGAQSKVELPGATWRTRAEYLPAVDDWENDYLIRAETSLDVPLLEWLSLVLTIADEYDNTPATGAQRNKLTTTGSLALRLL